MSEPPVLLDATREGVAVITLNRPDLRNAFNPDVIGLLSEYLEDLRTADGVRVVLVEGAGTVFSAGADLSWMKAAADWTEDENRSDARALGRMLHRLHSLPQPTVALVKGAAIAGGMGLVAACDMAIAVEGTQFGLSEVRLGLIPATISPYVIMAIGARAARRYFVTAERFDAAEAHRLGLVHEVVPDTQALAQTAERLVDEILQNAPGAIHDSKRLIDDFAYRPLSLDLVDETAERIARARVSAEGREGTAAFLEKRKPSWATGGA
jgi:methylglutaconyl-CoA hydratase